MLLTENRSKQEERGKEVVEKEEIDSINRFITELNQSTHVSVNPHSVYLELGS